MASEKRSIENDSLQFNISTIIVDIEGTTTSINFVKETLFPYVKENLKEYIESNWSDKELQEDVALLREQATKDLEDKLDGAVEIKDSTDDNVKTSVINNVLWQMTNDRKTKALKQLQGHIWRSGYASKNLVGHIYDEVKDCFKTWTEAGKKIYVYSSGSVEAQKLLFGNTKDGDLLPMFSGYFDTSIGAKTESDSYKNIFEHIKKSGIVNSPQDTLFLTDVANEAKAATEAGLKAVIVVREGNAPLTEEVKDAFPMINSFCDLTFEGNTKRRKLSDEKLVENSDNATKGKVTEEKDIEMEVCSSDNVTNSINEKSEAPTENVKASDDGTKTVSSSQSDKNKVSDVLKVEECKGKEDSIKKIENVVDSTETVNDGDNKDSTVGNTEMKVDETESKAEEKIKDETVSKPEEKAESVKTKVDKAEVNGNNTEGSNKPVVTPEEKVDKKDAGVDKKVVDDDCEMKEETKTPVIEKKELINNDEIMEEESEKTTKVETKENVEEKTNGDVKAVEITSEVKKNGETEKETVNKDAKDEIKSHEKTNGDTKTHEENREETSKDELKIEGKTTNGELKTDVEMSDDKVTGEILTDDKTAKEKTNGDVTSEVKSQEKKGVDGEKESDKEVSSSVKSPKKDTESLSGDSNLESTNNKSDSTKEENEMETDAKDKGETKTAESDKVDEVKPDKLEVKDCEKVENDKETDNKTDTIVKTNGTHEKNCKNGVNDDKSEEKVVKEKPVEKIVEKSTESNGIETAEKV